MTPLPTAAARALSALLLAIQILVLLALALAPRPALAALVAEYRFEETSYAHVAGEVTDWSGNGRHARTLGSASASTASGYTCRGVNLPYNSGSTITAVDTGFDLSSVVGATGSVSFWYYSDNTEYSDRTILDATTANNARFLLYRHDNSLSPGYIDVDMGMVVTSASGAEHSIYQNNVMSDGRWWHIAVTWKLVTGGGAARIQIYVDGSVVTSSSFSIATTGLASGISSLYIGDSRGTSYSPSLSAGGRFDTVRIYNHELSSTEVNSDKNATPSCTPPAPPAPAELIGRWRFDEAGWSGAAGEVIDTAGFAGGPFNGRSQGSPLAQTASASPARIGSPGTCGYGDFPGPAAGGGSVRFTGLPVSLSSGAQHTVAFWMYWNGSDGMPLGFDSHDLWFSGGHFGFNSWASDIYGISSSGLASGWHHVVAVFNNNAVTSNKLYIDGVAKSLSQRMGSPNNGNAVVSSTMVMGGVDNSSNYRFNGRLDEVHLYTGELSPTEVAALYAETHACTSLHHMRLTAASNSGVSCKPTTFTVQACGNADCSSPYTVGLTGNLSITGGGATVNYPSGSGFSIGSGSSSTTVSAQVVNASTATVGLTGLSLAPSSSPATWCGLGTTPTSGASCSYTTATAGFLVDVPDHRAEVAYPITIQAVKTADNSLACTPAFQGVSKSVRLSCGYANPSTGTLPARVSGTALNASANAAAACDGSGRTLSLAFDASGTASTTLQYADVGRLTLSANYTGSGSDAGLTMTGSDTFTVAPYRFGFSALPATALRSGVAFSATVSALNASDVVTPNFGRETSPEGATLGFVRTQPQGAAASNGAFSGSLGGFSGGSASSATLAWTEVGRGDLSARLTSGNYLSSGITLAGYSGGAPVYCAAEGGTCTLPTGAVATVYYGASGRLNAVAGLSGSVSCSNGFFGDPIVGTGKSCWYVPTGGSSNASSGALGPFRPSHFDVTATPACGGPSGFSYAGQAFASVVTARNAGGGLTQNYDGASGLSPTFAKAVTLADAPALGVGSLSGGAVAASAFTGGVATASLTYSLTNKLTGPQVLTLRATDTDATSSAGHSEGSTALRSGRLQLANRTGRADTTLQLPVRTEYYSGNAWVINTLDSCTTLAANAVVLGNRLNAQGSASAASTTASGVAMSSGQGMLTLSAPTPAGSSLTLDLALNLGLSGGQQSCRSGLGTGTPAGLPWLRSHNGACAATADRDPSARASFGVFAPETGKRVYTRDLY